MKAEEYVDRLAFCKSKGCPNLKAYEVMKYNKRIIMHGCNYFKYYQPEWIGEIDYCGRFERELKNAD